MIRKRKPGGGRKPHPVKYGIHPEFQEAMRNFDGPGYVLAWTAKVNPGEFYLIVKNRKKYPPEDARIKRIAKVLKYKGPCFDIPQKKKIANSCP